MEKGSLIPNLDLLRACAVLFVLIDHTSREMGRRYMPGLDIAWLGRIGVLFFFVHTSCVLMMSLERHRGEGLIAAFYVRRAFRIYPLSIAAVLAVLVGRGAPTLGFAGWLSNFALTQNLTFSPNAFGSIWSLPLEVQMYLFLPFIFLLARRARSPWPLLGLFLLSIPIALWEPGHIARASVLQFAPCFLPGVVTYWLFRNTRPKLPGWGAPLAIAIITAAMLVHPGWTYPAWFSCLALGLVMPLFRQIENTAVNAVSYQIAKYSYGIYLIHSILLLWMTPTWKTLPLYLLAVAGLSVIGYHLIEHPMVKLGQRLTAHRRPTVEPLAAHAG